MRSVVFTLRVMMMILVVLKHGGLKGPEPIVSDIELSAVKYQDLARKSFWDCPIVCMERLDRINHPMHLSSTHLSNRHVACQLLDSATFPMVVITEMEPDGHLTKSTSILFIQDGTDLKYYSGHHLELSSYGVVEKETIVKEYGTLDEVLVFRLFDLINETKADCYDLRAPWQSALC